MIGQERLKEKLFAYTLNDLPHSILFLGEEGCGKHTLVKELANNLNLSLVDISDSISLETIETINVNPVPTMYLVDTSVLTERHQNVILKFLEEPNNYTYIVLIASNKSYLLNTIVNRCIIFEFDKYTREQLETFIEDTTNVNKILEVCDTPGKVLSLNGNLNDLDKLCNTIVEKVHSANFSNTLSIVSKVNTKDEYDKFDFKLFFNMLLLSCYNHYATTYDNRYLEMYKFTSNYVKRLRDSRLNKELLLENFLTNLWEFVR